VQNRGSKSGGGERGDSPAKSKKGEVQNRDSKSGGGERGDSPANLRSAYKCGVAQLVEQTPVKRPVMGSNPIPTVFPRRDFSRVTISIVVLSVPPAGIV
jgi:hypothetical protein